jgi:aryl-alcohol dehydrogenase-like predicted oxidoreductase
MPTVCEIDTFMQYRPLGTTGLSVSAISFGAGPVSGLLTSTSVDTQRSVVSRAIELGVNWFDTAATYGQGQSEANLGVALAAIRTEQPLHVATKVRVQLTTEPDLRPLVVASVRESLARLRLPRVTLLQIHNSITRSRNDQPTSITPEDVLGPRGLLAGMEDVRAAGWVDHFGLTGIGDADALQIVMHSGRFATIQAPFHLLNPSALRATPANLCDPDHGGFLQTAHELDMGIFAIRVFAAGALLGAEPSGHTLQTPFFPLSLYRRDQVRAQQLAQRIGSLTVLRETALRYVLSQPQITSAIVGLGAVEHVEEAIRIADLELLPESELQSIERMCNSLP